MAFSVATNNRFDLFVDEDEEPEDLLTKQQRQVASERQRKDSEKKTSKGKSSGKQGQAQPNTATKPASGNSTTTKTTQSAGVTSVKRETGRPRAAEAAAVTQQSTSRQDVTFRERPERGREPRVTHITPAWRGRGAGRGGSTPASEDGFDRFGKREFERHSGSDKTGLKPVEKRSGAGAHNWGSITDAVQEAEDVVVRASASTTSAAAEEEDTEAGEDELVLRQLTLDEWKASQSGAKQPANKFNIRKPGEGCASDPSWKKMEVLRRKRDGEVDDGKRMDHSGQFDDAEEETSRNPKSVVQIPVTFSDSGRGRGRGGAGKPQRSVATPQQQQATLSDALVPNVESEQDFPCLS